MHDMKLQYRDIAAMYTDQYHIAQKEGSRIWAILRRIQTFSNGLWPTWQFAGTAEAYYTTENVNSDHLFAL